MSGNFQYWVQNLRCNITSTGSHRQRPTPPGSPSVSILHWVLVWQTRLWWGLHSSFSILSKTSNSQKLNPSHHPTAGRHVFLDSIWVEAVEATAVAAAAAVEAMAVVSPQTH